MVRRLRNSWAPISRCPALTSRTIWSSLEVSWVRVLSRLRAALPVAWSSLAACSTQARPRSAGRWPARPGGGRGPRLAAWPGAAPRRRARSGPARTGGRGRRSRSAASRGGAGLVGRGEAAASGQRWASRSAVPTMAASCSKAARGRPRPQAGRCGRPPRPGRGRCRRRRRRLPAPGPAARISWNWASAFGSALAQLEQPQGVAGQGSRAGRARGRRPARSVRRPPGRRPGRPAVPPGGPGWPGAGRRWCRCRSRGPGAAPRWRWPWPRRRARDQLHRGQVLEGHRQQPDRALLPGLGHGPGVQGALVVLLADDEGSHPGPEQPARVVHGPGQGDRLGSIGPPAAPSPSATWPIPWSSSLRNSPTLSSTGRAAARRPSSAVGVTSSA